MQLLHYLMMGDVLPQVLIRWLVLERVAVKQAK